jgi:hypothetical protein
MTKLEKTARIVHRIGESAHVKTYGRKTIAWKNLSIGNQRACLMLAQWHLDKLKNGGAK